MSLTAKAELVNTAMAHLGEPAFATIATDPPGAALAKVLGQLDGRAGVELAALSRHPWLCALQFASLSAAARAGNHKWAKVFDLPSTFVKMWAVEGDNTAYLVGSEVVSGVARKVVWANVAALDVVFTEQRDFEAYTPDLLNYMAYALASRTAGPLKNDYEGAARLKREAEVALLAAMMGEAGQWREDEALVPFIFAALRAQAS